MPAGSSQKGRKLGRNAAACKSYRDRGQLLKNQKLRAARHVKRVAFFAARAGRAVEIRRAKRVLHGVDTGTAVA